MRSRLVLLGFLLSILTLMPMCASPARPPVAAESEVIVAAKGTATRSTTDDANDSASPIPVTSADPIWGHRKALVTIVMFSDFQCPFCARVEPTLRQVRETYGPDHIRIVWKNQPLPFHEKAKPAAEAAQTVFALGGADAFWKFHEAAFTNQSRLGPDAYAEWAALAGVDSAAFARSLANHEATRKVDEDIALASRVGANGTPAFRINGVELSGAQPFAKFKEIIDAELAKAKAAVSAGTPLERLYVARSTENFKNRPVPADDDDEPAEDTKTRWRVPVGNSPSLGNPNAPVTIVEFSDFQCPYCKKVEKTLEQIRSRYADKVRLVWKHEPLPFHPRAMPAAELAIEARAQQGDKGFWLAHDKLFEMQPKLEDADLEDAAKALNLNVARVKASLKNRTHKATIDADMGLADDIQASGTPHFFINGRRLVGAHPLEKFAKLIDEEIALFDDQKIKLAGAKYYDFLMKDAKGAPEPETKASPPVPTTSPYRGAKNAKVVIQQWSDFQCPFCSRVEPTMTEVLKTFGNRVKIVWRDKPLPMHPDAAEAAEAAREAMAQKGLDGFWKMHKLLFEHQRELSRGDLEHYASEVGLDLPRFRQALDKHTHKALVDADDNAGSAIGITGTPSFLINGYYVSGAQPFARFKKTIERALAEVK